MVASPARKRWQRHKQFKFREFDCDTLLGVRHEVAKRSWRTPSSVSQSDSRKLN
jgi:hypothetical protein